MIGASLQTLRNSTRKCVPLIKQVDHRVLNKVEGLENPTAENIAAWFLQRIKGCELVRVYENDDCWAEVTA